MFDMSQVVEEQFQDIEEIREAVAVEAIPHLDNQALTAKQVQAVLVWQGEGELGGTQLDLVVPEELALQWKCRTYKH